MEAASHVFAVNFESTANEEHMGRYPAKPAWLAGTAWAVAQDAQKLGRAKL